MKKIIGLSLSVLVSFSVLLKAEDHGHAAATSVSPADALIRLKEGNARYVADKPTHPNQDSSRRKSLASSQTPFAIVVGCADSRTSPEVLFDQGLGDLFVLRVAGNVVNDNSIGSIEYAVDHLGSKLIVVLGHERCGAVKAARETIASNGKAPGHIQSLVAAIEPAVKTTAAESPEVTVMENVRHVVKQLKNSDPILSPKVKSGDVIVKGGYYDLDTGEIVFFD